MGYSIRYGREKTGNWPNSGAMRLYGAVVLFLLIVAGIKLTGSERLLEVFLTDHDGLWAGMNRLYAQGTELGEILTEVYRSALHEAGFI